MENKPKSYPRKVRFRPIELSPGYFGVQERITGAIISDGFSDYSAAWSFIVNELLKPDGD
jgi:hypothetical protein